MIFCARATRGLRRPSPGLLARFGVPVGGRVRKLRAVDDQSAPIPEEIASELGRIIVLPKRAVVIILATLSEKVGADLNA